MIGYSEQEGFIRPKGIKFKEGQDPNIRLPKVAVGKRLGVDYFTFYYAGDNLDSTEWDERSLSGLTNIDKKKEVMLLALELAVKIND